MRAAAAALAVALIGAAPGAEAESINQQRLDVLRKLTGDRSTVRPTVDLPQPLSPTSPSVSPGAISKLTPSTA